MRFGILGPVEVMGPGGPTAIGRPRHRALLAYLLLHADKVVARDRLIEAIWGGAEPGSARAQIHVAVSELRRALRQQGLEKVIVTQPGGYQFVLADGDLDLDVFNRQVKAAHDLEKHDLEESARGLRAALRLWRGEALADITASYARPARQGLHEQWLRAQELLADAELALGRHDSLIPELTRLFEAHPARERLARKLMLAQYRAGLQAEALRTARRLRARLVEEQGLDPSAQFWLLEKAVLNADPALDPEPEPPVRAGAVAPAQLPFDTGGFTGRERELAELDVLADVRDRAAVVLIVGTAGVGKTALAVRWAHRHRERFPGGQLYVNLRGFDPDRPPLRPGEVLRRFLSSLGVEQGTVPDDVDEAAALFRSVLARRSVLVVLDNAADAEQVRPLLPGSAGSAVLVTSRNRLRRLVAVEGAGSLHLDPLTEEEAVGLLRGTRTDATDDEESVRQVALRCACLPLALRLAAAQMAGRQGLTFADYARELAADDALSVLDEHGDMGGAVSGAFRLSYQALAPASRRLFRLLSLVPGPDFPPVTAAALLGVTPSGVRRPLEELCIGHLVSEHAPGRYTMHDLLRRYAAGACANDEPESGREEAARRLVDFYAETAFEAYPLLQPRRLEGDRALTYLPRQPLRFADRASALEWHDQERENLVGAIAMAAERGWYRTAWQLTADLLAYFVIRRRWPEWLSALRAGRLAAGRSADPVAVAHMENALGMVHKQMGRYAAARTHYARAIELASAAGDRRSVARSNANLGGLCVTEGDLEAGVRHLWTALDIPEYGQQPQHAVAAHINLGCALIDMERYPEATDALDRALAFAAEIDDVQQAAYCHHNLAEIALRRGDQVIARRHADRQLRLAEAIGDPMRRAAALDCLASALAAEDRAAAREHWSAAHRIYQGLGHHISTVLAEWLRVFDSLDPAELAAADEARRRRCRRLI
ncbi:AfsR/SARP family transcriptional regulator [Nonomuraea jiangxiensis]|uniref:DNA-binding transcriptional activator of the SARP family n=1 Tax=Nonomuraea jiangxiensis TaxID=633440 RepID=A0A1G8Q6I2_9ACTN|nr:BTAD domain-containing putative transcriptional regulator [Nonomuraea jiangxiensis]SDJ00045.1 DNA-binding transcriptional activator of the SARP family [Nonomuraea jiangxiensis]